MKKKILSLFFILVVVFSCFNNFFASDDISGDIILKEIHRKSNVIFFESNFDYPEYSPIGSTMDNFSCKVGTKANLDINIDLEGKYYYYSSNIENLYVFNEPVNIFFSSDSRWYYTLIDKLDVTYDVYKVKYTGVSSNKFYIDETCLTESGKLSTKYNTTSSYIERSSTSADFYYYVICNKFTNLDVYADKNKTLKLNKVIDDSIKDNNSKLKITYEYNEAKTECKINATLEDGAFTDKIYYSNIAPGVSGNLISKKSFPLDGITVYENQSLFFQAEDNNGNVLATNGISINGINKMNPDDFVVNIEKFNCGVNFTPNILNSEGFVYQSLYFNISDFEGLNFKKVGEPGLDNGEFIEGYYRKIDIGSTYSITNTSFSKKSFTLSFQVKNRETGEIMLTKNYDLTIGGQLSGGSSIDGGVINPGDDDEQQMTPDNDKNIKPGVGGNPFIGLNENSSLNDMINATKETFSVFKQAFSILPGFIWGIISILLVICIALRILGR